MRALAILCVALAVGGVFIQLVGERYPVRDWLIWTVLQLWGWECLQAASMIAFGDLLLGRLLRTTATSGLERLTLASALGALAFGLGMFAAGVFRCLTPAWAVLWPLTMLAMGTWNGRETLRFCLRFSPRSSRPLSLAAGAALAFGTLCLGLLYLGVFSPDAVSYDAAWTHLTIAQDYAREGRIVPFDADWPKNLAHFSSLITTWAFLLPGLGPPPVRWMMALHIEFGFVVLTLVGVAAGVNWTLEKPIRSGWVVLFLFPGIFVDEGSLGGGADHFAAFFVAPLLLAAGNGARTMDRRWWRLVGVLAGGAIITKYQTFYYLVPIAAYLAVVWAHGLALSIRNPPPFRDQLRLWGSRLACPGWALASVAIVTAPHFVRNWIFYGNPVFPFAQRLFPGSKPWLPDGGLMAETIISHFGSKPPAEWTARLVHSVRMVFEFSLAFKVHVPVVGSLFTLALPLLILLPGARRIRLMALLGMATVFVWAWTWPVERNLQIFVPLLAIATGGTLARAWELGYASRIAAIVLVGVQLIWSGDHFFLGSGRVASAITLIRSGFDGHAASRFDGYAVDRVAIGRALPPDAKVLLHSYHLNLGFDRPVLHDTLGFQSLIDPRTFMSPRDLYDRLHALGVTHIVYYQYPAPTKQGEVIFAAFVDRYQGDVSRFGDFRLLPMPNRPPFAEPPYTVLSVGINGYTDGIYDVSALSAVEIMPAELRHRGAPRMVTSMETALSGLGSVNAVLLGDSGKPLRDKPALTEHFRMVREFPGFSVWVHRR